MIQDKIVTADEAVALIRDGDVVSCSGFVGIGTPEAVITALQRRFLETRGPSGGVCGATFAAQLKREVQANAQLARELNLTAE